MNSYKRKLMNVPNVIVGLWLLGMFTIYPLIYHNFYYNILQVKYATVLVLTLLMISAFIFICGFSGGFSNFFDDITNKGFKKWFAEEFSVWDICIMIYILITVISTALASPYIFEAILGNEGRYSGLLLISLYVAIYFIVSRFFSFSKIYFTVFLTVSIPVCLFGYTDYFNMDILGFKEGIEQTQWSSFTSTIGNINTYTAVIAFYIAVAGTLFITAPLKCKKNDKGESIIKIVFYYIIMFMNFIALTMGNSDNGYLTLAAFFGFMPFVAFHSMEGVRRYVLTLFTYCLGIKIIQIINIRFAGKVLGISGLYDFISDFKYLNLLIILLAVIVIVMYAVAYLNINSKFNDKGQIAENEVLLKVLRYMWLATLITGVLFVIYIIISVNANAEAGRAKYGTLADYLIFNDTWGTYRGYIWRAALEEYANLNILHHIFGSGPDTFGIYMWNIRLDEMTSVTGQFFDAAHNEYIQFLFTLGPVATVAYILALILPSVKALRIKIFNPDKSPFLYASAFAVICYATQAVVNLNLPVVTPFLWIFLSIMVSLLRDKGEV